MIHEILKAIRERMGCQCSCCNVGVRCSLGRRSFIRPTAACRTEAKGCSVDKAIRVQETSMSKCPHLHNTSLPSFFSLIFGLGPSGCTRSLLPRLRLGISLLWAPSSGTSCLSLWEPTFILTSSTSTCKLRHYPGREQRPLGRESLILCKY